MRRSLSIIELVVASAVLLITLVGVMSMTTGSVRATQEATPRKVAQDVAARILARMRSTLLGTSYAQFYGNPTRRSINSVTWAVPTEGGPTGLDQEAQPMFDLATQGQIAPPSDDPAYVRVRVMNEVEYAATWNVGATDLDFDGDGGADAAEPPSGAYGMLPVVIEVRWGDPYAGNDGRITLTTLISQPMQGDPNR
ncbi:MAG TPA: hypothetical protein DEA08_16305 [Planctomycetes bacterium]|nr:hypothetical protein [Planctomycetota bacterium]